MHTRTGNLPIGFRRLRSSPWQRDLSGLLAWAGEQDFPLIDLGPDADLIGRQVLESGFAIGSADLPDWQGLISADAGRRKAAVQKNAAYIGTCASIGRGGGRPKAVRNFFLVMLPEKPEAPRRDNFTLMVDSLNDLAPVLDQTDSRLVIEGWPGPGALCCTPETIRATIKACPSPRIGLNYDPSHLIRMSIDPLRFLEEFAHRVFHVHGKDTEILGENLYEYGTEQPPTFGTPHGFGSICWRYCIPGKGVFRWTRGLEILATHGYQGAISIELEDENFNGSESGEKRGFLAAAQFLSTC